MGRQSGMNWAVRVIAPWCLGVGALVSFTADAGQDPGQGWNVAPLAARTSARGAGDGLTGDTGLDGRGRLESAHLIVGAPEDFRSIQDEREPHIDLKPNVERFPEVDRTHKGDPIVGMRPTFDSRLPGPAGAEGASETELAFHIDGATTSVFLAPRGDLPGDANLDGANAGDTGAPTTQRGSGDASPAQRGSATTQRFFEAVKERAAHGATPQVLRAVALGSSTPAQPDALPIEVASFPRAVEELAPAERPDYASLVDQDKLDREKRCLAEAVYFESRSEPEDGQAAVAQVVLNRVSSGLYPSSVCGVVYQNRHHYHRCQFSFACEGRSLRIAERDAWASAVRIANEVMNGRTYISDVGRSTHYHANYVRPRWAKQLKKMDAIGHHIFYRLKPGQT
ncbi:MAG: cell wall hydrolase [Methylocystis sp.]|nr:cell wall hydrolase [Methylocystis sp.]MBI3275768.1 cell wall hydrolase [Methylocystis sp.]